MENKYLDEVIDVEETEQEGFVVDGLDTANWCFKKLAAIKQKEDEITKVAEAEIERITAWRDAELNKYKSDKEFFNSKLIDYYRTEKEKDPKFRLTSPYGKVTSRKGTKKWEYTNPERVIEVLKERGLNEFIRVKEEIKRDEIKKTFHATDDGTIIDINGEVLEGAYVSENPTTFTVKVNE